MSKKDLKLTNLSDGETDGVALFYVKDRQVYPVILDREQAEMLDLIIATPFVEKPLKVYSEPTGTLSKIISKDGENNE